MRIFFLKGFGALSMCVFMCVAANTFVIVNAGEMRDDENSGKCGEDVYWTYDTSKRILTITGNGNMTEYSDGNDVPWASVRGSIEAAVIGSGVTSIAPYSFYSGYAFRSVTLPSTLESIQKYAFFYSRLTSIEIPENVRFIDDLAFCCSDLTKFKVDDKNRYFRDIDGVLFNKNGTSLMIYPAAREGTQYAIPNSTISLFALAFRSSQYLTSVTIPDSVTTIGRSAFESCGALTNAIIPASVISIGTSPYNSCTKLTSIEVEAQNPAYKSDDGVLFNKEGTTLLQYPLGKKDASYTIPDSVTTIERFAAFGCVETSSMVIPASVRLIETRAFGNSNSLVNVTFLGVSEPENSYPFYLSKKLSVVYVPLDYSSKTFGNLSVCKRESFDETQVFENPCFEVVDVSGKNCLEKRPNASEWESKSNGCVAYKCDKDYGFSSLTKCRTSNNVCVNNECAKEEGKPDQAWIVNLTIDENDDVVLVLNTTDIVESICELTGLKPDDILVEVEMDGDGRILTVVIYTDEEKTATMIMEAVKKLDKGVNCSHGVLCRTKSVFVLKNDQTMPLSEAGRGSLSLFVLMMIITAMVTVQI